MHLVVLFFFNLPEYGDTTFFLVPATPLKKPLIGHNGTQQQERKHYSIWTWLALRSDALGYMIT